MKTERNILIAFILNLSFSIFEIVGGFFTGSVAIMSDAIHDMGDALSIGVSYFLKRKSKRRPDEKYTYGYARYSVIGSAITILILLMGSVIVIYNAIGRIIKPTEIKYDGMIIFAVIGMIVNLCAALVTRDGSSLNQKAVNLHMIEDVLGWAVVLVGAVIMRFTGILIIDPIMSIGVALFIIVNSIRHLKDTVCVLLEKTPDCIDVNKLREHICEVDGVLDVHHIHVWSMDGRANCATMHIVANGDEGRIKEIVRKEAGKCGIGHITLEFEVEGERCCAEDCRIEHSADCGHHGHHHHHG